LVGIWERIADCSGDDNKSNNNNIEIGSKSNE
jgi:hypothetical protein